MATAPRGRISPGKILNETEHYLVEGVSWRTYQSLLRDFERSGSNVRLTYDRGRLEFMSPARKHEGRKKRLARMVEDMAAELNIPFEWGGSMTFHSKSKKRGLEPDECYWIAHEPRMRERDDFDSATDPPPDLVIEVENTRRILDRLGILAALGVPEVWRAGRDGLTVGLLQPDGSYAWGQASQAFPFLDMADFARFLARTPGEGQTAWMRRFRNWVSAELVPQHARPEGE